MLRNAAIKVKVPVPFVPSPLCSPLCLPIFGRIANAQARTGDPKAALTWVRGLDCLDKAYALMGVADGMMQNGE